MVHLLCTNAFFQQHTHLKAHWKKLQLDLLAPERLQWGIYGWDALLNATEALRDLSCRSGDHFLQPQTFLFTIQGLVCVQKRFALLIYFCILPTGQIFWRIVVFKLKSFVYVTGKLQKRPAWSRTLIAKLIKVDSVRCVNKCQSGSWGWTLVNEVCGGGSSAGA